MKKRTHYYFDPAEVEDAICWKCGEDVKVNTSPAGRAAGALCSRCGRRQ